jgi:hypothetical protein
MEKEKKETKKRKRKRAHPISSTLVARDERAVIIRESPES